LDQITGGSEAGNLKDNKKRQKCQIRESFHVTLLEDGIPELIASLVLAKDFLKLWEPQSTIFS
jgi:hypothetical protein